MSRLDGTVAWLVDDNDNVVGYKRKDGTEGALAQLATDAGGNVVGLGYGAIPASTSFGPPATIFRLRMRCSGGSAVVTVAATKRSGGSDTFVFSLASGGDIVEPMYADDYSSLVWTKTGSGSVTVEVI